MRIFKSLSASAFVAVILVGAVAGVQAAPAARHGHRHGLRYADSSPPRRLAHGRSGPVTLVGDRESGLGFYDLPARYRNHRPVYDGRGDAIRYAVASEAGASYYGAYLGDVRARGSHRVFNPVDGYGSPFFAGYYGPAGDPDDDRGPFGNTYD